MTTASRRLGVLIAATTTMGPHRFSAFCRTVYSPSYGFSAMKLDVNLDGAMFLSCPAKT